MATKVKEYSGSNAVKIHCSLLLIIRVNQLMIILHLEYLDENENFFLSNVLQLQPQHSWPVHYCFSKWLPRRSWLDNHYHFLVANIFDLSSLFSLWSSPTVFFCPLVKIQPPHLLFSVFLSSDHFFIFVVIALLSSFPSQVH